MSWGVGVFFFKKVYLVLMYGQFFVLKPYGVNHAHWGYIPVLYRYRYMYNVMYRYYTCRGQILGSSPNHVFCLNLSKKNVFQNDVTFLKLNIF